MQLSPSSFGGQARKLPSPSEYSAGLRPRTPHSRGVGRRSIRRKDGSPPGLLRQVQDETRNERRDADYDEKRSTRDRRQVSRLRDKDVQNRRGVDPGRANRVTTTRAKGAGFVCPDGP